MEYRDSAPPLQGINIPADFVPQRSFLLFMKKISADASISGNASPVTVPFTAYLAAKGFLEDLLAELGDEVIEVRGRLVLAKGCLLYTSRCV